MSPPLNRCKSGSSFFDEILQATVWSVKNGGCGEKQESSGSGVAAVQSSGLDKSDR